MTVVQAIKHAAGTRPDVWTNADIFADVAPLFPRLAKSWLRKKIQDVLKYYRRNGWIETISPGKTPRVPGRYLWLQHRKGLLTEKSLAEVPY